MIVPHTFFSTSKTVILPYCITLRAYTIFLLINSGISCDTSAIWFDSINSPHVWGKSLYRFWGIPEYGLAPTCVGKMKWTWRAPQWTGAHPHMRGENLEIRMLMQTSSGSPPHAWGKYRSCYVPPIVFRLTPTCVGKMEYGFLRLAAV